MGGLGAGAGVVETPVLGGVRRVRRCEMSAAMAGARARRAGSYVDERIGSVECSDKPSSNALEPPRLDHNTHLKDAMELTCKPSKALPTI